ncbi:MAG TPA: hypothetical protein VK065_06815 [Brevibacterium sp.]|nr:hypothetical protein [Brevibacterium sp.]
MSALKVGNARVSTDERDATDQRDGHVPPVEFEAAQSTLVIGVT